MDLSRTRVVLRERAIFDILDLALRFVVTHLGLYARCALIVLPPLFLASVALARYAGWIAAWSFALFSTTFVAAPFTALASRLVFAGDVRVAPAVRAGLGSAGRLLVLRLAAIVEILIGVTMLLLPSVWFLALTLFTTEVTLLEHATVRGALTRSVQLAARQGVEAVSALVCLALLPAVLVLSVDVGGRAVIAALLQARAPDPMWSEGGSVLALLGFWLFVPYGATLRFLVYLDVRTRSEGWDIQTRFAAIAARPAPEARSAA